MWPFFVRQIWGNLPKANSRGHVSNSTNSYLFALLAPFACQKREFCALKVQGGVILLLGLRLLLYSQDRILAP